MEFPDYMIPWIVKALEIQSTSPAMGEAAKEVLDYINEQPDDWKYL